MPLAGKAVGPGQRLDQLPLVAEDNGLIGIRMMSAVLKDAEVRQAVAEPERIRDVRIGVLVVEERVRLRDSQLGTSAQHRRNGVLRGQKFVCRHLWTDGLPETVSPDQTVVVPVDADVSVGKIDLEILLELVGRAERLAQPDVNLRHDTVSLPHRVQYQHSRTNPGALKASRADVCNFRSVLAAAALEALLELL